jgi:hypothetical protein
MHHHVYAHKLTPPPRGYLTGARVCFSVYAGAKSSELRPMAWAAVQCYDWNEVCRVCCCVCVCTCV